MVRWLGNRAFYAFKNPGPRRSFQLLIARIPRTMPNTCARRNPTTPSATNDNERTTIVRCIPPLAHKLANRQTVRPRRPTLSEAPTVRHGRDRLPPA